MSRQVWKYAVPSEPGPFVLSMPQGAEMLSVQMQGGAPQLWAVTHSNAEREDRMVFAVMTWAPMPYGRSRHLGTVLFDDGAFVLHYFEP